MRARWLLFVAIACAVPLTASGGGDKNENPFKKAKVGDFLSYKMATTVKGTAIEATMKQTVTAISEKEAKVKTAIVVNGMNFPGGADITIDLTKPYDPTSAALQKNPNGKFEKKDEGKEKIKIGDKTYDCTWISGKLVVEKGIKINSDMKVWFAKSVHMSGLVKMEMKSDLANVTMELTESGNEK
jgi:hypothetical protein